MKYKKLPELRNTYPVTADLYREQFSGDDSSIKYTGIYPENFIIFNSIPNSEINLNTITTDDSIKFRFIVQFIDGTDIDEWTSVEFKSDLIEAKRDEVNPYFTKGRVTVAQIDFGKLREYHTTFLEKETFAQVVVNSTISTKEDIIRHINWMVDPIKDEIRTASDFGSWTVNEPIKFGVEFISEESLKPKVIESDSVESTIAETVKIDYSPFGVPGKFIGDIKTKRRGFLNIFKTRYSWTGTNWQKL